MDIIDGESLTFSQSFACPDCEISITEIEPRSFSFNNPFGACPDCFGLGYKMEFDARLMVPDESLSLNGGAIQVMGWQSSKDKGSFTHALLEALAAEAKRRGVSYGHLVADTTERERAEIIRDYCAKKRRSGRKK